MEVKTVAKNYRFMAILIGAMVLGAIAGLIWPVVRDADGSTVREGAAAIGFLGTVFINLMFCIVVPLVFASISSAVANMKSRLRAGKIMGVTVAVFVVTGAIAAVVYFLLVQIFPPVTAPWAEIPAEEVGEYATLRTLLVNFFTASDFVGLLTRRAMLPLIVFSLLFGFSVNLCGAEATVVAKFLEGLTAVMLKFVHIVTYYAPVAFFAIFAELTATYGPQVTETYGRALLLYYPVCFLYVFTAWPLFAWFGGGKDAVKVMFQHIARPAIVSLGTCSSVATIPTNLEVAAETGISKDVSDIVLPLGATMHMDGSCFSCVLKVAFVMGVFGIPMGFSMLVPVVLVAVRRPRRRLHWGVHHLFHLLPPANGHGLPHSGGHWQPGGPARHDDQRRWGLRRLLHRLPLRGRQRLAAKSGETVTGRLEETTERNRFYHVQKRGGTGRRPVPSLPFVFPLSSLWETFSRQL